MMRTEGCKGDSSRRCAGDANKIRKEEEKEEEEEENLLTHTRESIDLPKRKHKSTGGYREGLCNGDGRYLADGFSDHPGNGRKHVFV